VEDESRLVADVAYIVVEERIGLATQEGTNALGLAWMVVVGLCGGLGTRDVCMVVISMELALVEC